MTDFERQAYANMESIDRISLWMVKCVELTEFSDILTSEDIKRIGTLCGLMGKEGIHG